MDIGWQQVADSVARQPKYPNQQLRSVSIETYFPGRLRALSALGDVQDAVEDALPNLFVPNIQPGESVALRPYQLRDEEQKRSLAVSVNQVTYVSFDYPGFDAFSAEALPLVGAVLSAIKPKKLNRVVYRYENEVGIARESGGALPVDRIFPGILPRVFSNDGEIGPCRSLDIGAEHHWKDGDAEGVRGFHAWLDESSGTPSLRVAVLGVVENCDGVTDLPRATKAAHRVSVGLFESLISDEYRRFISSVREEQDDAGDE